MHDEGVVQETPSRWTELKTLGKLSVVGVQVEPFHASTEGSFPLGPVAMQKVVLVQDTLNSLLSVESAAAWTTLHALPFHCSMSGANVPAKSAAPTATQKLVVTHETPLRYGEVAFGTEGIGSDDQAEPFHSSATVAPFRGWSPLPTAMQKAEVTHETAASVFVAVAAVGLGMVVQFDALTCAGTVRPCGVAAWAAPEPRSASAISAAATPAVKIRTGARMTTSVVRGVTTRRRACAPSSVGRMITKSSGNL